MLAVTAENTLETDPQAVFFCVLIRSHAVKAMRTMALFLFGQIKALEIGLEILHRETL